MCSKIFSPRSGALNQKFIAVLVFWSSQCGATSILEYTKHRLSPIHISSHADQHFHSTFRKWNNHHYRWPQNQTVTAYRKGGALEMDENIESALEKIKYTFWNLLSDEENFLAHHNEGV